MHSENPIRNNAAFKFKNQGQLAFKIVTQTKDPGWSTLRKSGRKLCSILIGTLGVAICTCNGDPDETPWVESTPKIPSEMIQHFNYKSMGDM